MISYYNQIGQITSYYLYHQKRTKLYCRLKECNLFPSYFRSYFKCLLESLSACIFVSMLCVNTVCLYLCISKSVGLSFLYSFFVYPSSSFVSACMDCLSFFNYQVYLKKNKDKHLGTSKRLSYTCLCNAQLYIDKTPGTPSTKGTEVFK